MLLLAFPPPPQDETSWAPWLLLGAVLLVLAAGITARWVRRRRTVWRRFAERHGLSFEEHAGDGRKGAGRGPRVHGRIDGHALVLEPAPESSDVGELGAHNALLALELDSPPPPDLEVLSAPGLAGKLERALEHPDFSSGDPRLDGLAVVRAPDAEAARSWLTEPRRAALARFLEAEPGDVAGVRGGRLFIEGRVLRADLDRLEGWLSELRRAARELRSGVE